MPFDAIERSADDRRPVELFTFFRDFQAFRYTSADRNVTFAGAEFEARPLTRGPIETSSEMARGSMRVTCPRDLPVADLFRITPPTIPITFVLQQFHFGDNEAATLWTGRVVTVEFQGTAAQITLEPIYTSLRRVGLRRMYQRQCPHVLYGTACRVNREAFKVDGLVDSASGATVSIAAAATQPNGHFSGGFIEYAIELGILERRFIIDHVRATLSLSAQPIGIQVGAAVKVFPGCDHTPTTCADKFNNVANYGGFPFFTKKNPFGGNPIY